MSVRLVALVTSLVAVALSGCIADDATPDSTVEPGEGEVIVTDPETGATTTLRTHEYVHPGAAPEQIWIRDNWTGSFEATDFWDGGQEYLWLAGQQTSSHQSLDITSLIPIGVPTWLMLEVDLDFAEGDVDIWITAPNEDVWSADFDTPRGGYSRIETMMVYSGDGPVMLNMFYDEREGTEGFDFTVYHEVFSTGDALFPGIPMTVDVPSGAASVELRFLFTPGDVLVWSPDDEYLGRFSPEGDVYNHTLDLEARGGEYVFLVPSSGGPARVTAYVPTSVEGVSETLDLGVVTQVITATDAAPVTMNEPVTYEFEVTGYPLQVGMQLILDRFTHGVDMSLTGPNGTLMDWDFSDTLPFYTTGDNGMRFGGTTPLGATELGPGTYTIDFTGDPHGDGTIHGWIVTYQR